MNRPLMVKEVASRVFHDDFPYLGNGAREVALRKGLDLLDQGRAGKGGTEHDFVG